MSPYEVLGFLRLAIELTAISPAVLWVFYIACMTIQRSHPDDKYKWWEYLYAFPVVALGYIIDVYVNYTFMSLFMWEWPLSWGKEKTVSERLNRYYFASSGWRKEVTAWVGPLLLDKWDRRGRHIGYRDE